MELVTVRELRNSGGEVLRHVERGERIVVTRDGTPVAELRPLPHPSFRPAELIRRRMDLPRVNSDGSARHLTSDRSIAVSEQPTRGMLDTSTVIRLGEIADRRPSMTNR
jgi:prevent-host-death family protein